MTTGGNKIAALAKKAKKGSVSYQVGFFDNAEYDDGTKVADVAVKHEFGIGVPERPFFKKSNGRFLKAAKGLSKRLVKKGVVDSKAVSKVAELHKGIVSKQIKNLRNPTESKATIEAKGFSNPLVETGHMRQSVTYKKVKGVIDSR